MSKLYNTAKKAFFEPIKKALKKETNIGKRITKIPANVPQDRLSKATRDLKLAIGRRRGSEAKLKQTQFEMDQANKGKGDYDFTFDPLKANVKKESVKKRNKKSEEIFKAAKGRKFNKGGRVGKMGGGMMGRRMGLKAGSNGSKKGKVPTTEKEKSLAKLAPPRNRITFGDVVAGRTKGAKNGKTMS